MSGKQQPHRLYEEIARRCEASRAHATKHLARDVLPCGGGFACFSGKGGFANRVVGIGIPPTPSASEMDAVLRFFAERDVDEAVVEISPYADPDLIKLLGEKGFVLKHTINTLMLELSSFSPPPQRNLPDHVTIDQLRDKSDEHLLREIVEANERGFDAKDPRLLPEVTIALALKALRASNTEGFYVRENAKSEMVAVGMMETHEGLATLFGATTTPEFRGLGLQRALMIERVILAKERGCDYAVVLTSPGKTTEHNAIALGFSMAHTIVALKRPTRAI